MKIPKPYVYTASNAKSYEVFFRIRREINDSSEALLRYQVYYGDQTFGVDVKISNSRIEQYQLDNIVIHTVCIQKICNAIEAKITEYCMLEIGTKDILNHQSGSTMTGKFPHPQDG